MIKPSLSPDRPSPALSHLILTSYPISKGTVGDSSSQKTGLRKPSTHQNTKLCLVWDVRWLTGAQAPAPQPRTGSETKGKMTWSWSQTCERQRQDLEPSLPPSISPLSFHAKRQRGRAGKNPSLHLNPALMTTRERRAPHKE